MLGFAAAPEREDMGMLAQEQIMLKGLGSFERSISELAGVQFLKQRFLDIPSLAKTHPAEIDDAHRALFGLRFPHEGLFDKRSFSSSITLMSRMSTPLISESSSDTQSAKWLMPRL